MDLQLKQKHVLITGGSKGIGLACAQAFLAEGAHVTLVARHPDTLTQAREGLLKTHPQSRVHTVSGSDAGR